MIRSDDQARSMIEIDRSLIRLYVTLQYMSRTGAHIKIISEQKTSPLENPPPPAENNRTIETCQE